MKQKFYLLCAALLILAISLNAQSDFQTTYKRYQGEAGIKKKMSELLFSPPKDEMTDDQKLAMAERPEFNLGELTGFRERIASIKTKKETNALEEDESLDEPSTADNAKALSIATKSPFNVWSNFLASTFEEGHLWPPDPNGAVGTHQLVVLMNAGIKVFEKRNVTDAPLVTPKGISNNPAPAQLFIKLDQFFSPVLRGNAFTSDPHVRFDRLTKRWFVVAIDVDPSFKTTNFILIAVSDGEQITNATSFTFYRIPTALFPYNTSNPIKPFLDYPTLGVDKNAVLIGGSLFFLNSSGSEDSIYSAGYAINKQQLLRGQLSFNSIQFGFASRTRSGGMYVPQGTYNDDPTAAKSFFTGTNFPQTSILLAGLNYNNNGQLTGITGYTVPVERFQYPPDVTAPGSPMPIEPNDTRLLAAAIYKNKITGKNSLWTAHAIGVNQAGQYLPPDSLFITKARTASRWYEIDNIYSTPHLNQLGTVYDATKSSGRRALNYFNSSIAANGQGHAALGGTTAAFNRYLNVFVAGRTSDAASGILGAPTKTTNAHAIYAPTNRSGSYIGRWGDFSQTVVDPMDDQTIWTFQEYANADDSYGVRAVQLKAPPPATPVPLGPLSNKTDNTVTIKGISNDNSGFFDPGTDQGGPGYNRLTVKSTGNIIASNVKFISPTEITFTLNTKNKPVGKYTIIITNPDGQLVATEYRLVRNIETTEATGSNVPITQAANEKLQQSFIKTSTAFPNPAEDNVTVQMNAAKDYAGKVVLLDLTGRRVFEQSYKFLKGRNEVQLSLSKYSKGTYIIAIFNSNNFLISTHKIVKN
jgi:hypothetical protein